MKIEKLKIVCIVLLLLCHFNLKAQEEKDTVITENIKVSNIVPRIGIGASRHFISEFGIAYMRSNFTNEKDLGLNANNFIYYIGFEAMAPYKKPVMHGYKIGVEMVSVGHVTSAFGIEMTYYKKDTLSGLALFPKLGIPLINGSLSYGIGLYFNSEVRKEIGRHRITLTYCFNRKSDKKLDYMILKHKKNNR